MRIKILVFALIVTAVALFIRVGIDHNFYRKEIQATIVQKRLCLPVKVEACIFHPNNCDAGKEICTMNIGYHECKEYERPCDAPADWTVTPYHYQTDNFWLQ